MENHTRIWIDFWSTTCFQCEWEKIGERVRERKNKRVREREKKTSERERTVNPVGNHYFFRWTITGSRVNLEPNKIRELASLVRTFQTVLQGLFKPFLIPKSLHSLSLPISLFSVLPFGNEESYALLSGSNFASIAGSGLEMYSIQLCCTSM